MKLGYLQKLSLIDYPKKLCATVFTAGCNFRCRYCHNPELVEVPASASKSASASSLSLTPSPCIPETDFFAFLRRRVGLLDGVTITGGEPTTNPGIEKFCREIKSLGFLVKCDTNGSNPEVLRRLISEGAVDYIAMDVKAPLPRYPEIVGVAVDPEAIAASISLLQAAKIDYEFRTTVVAGELQAADFVEIGKLIAGAPLHFLQGFVPSKTLDPSYTKRLAPTAAEMQEFQHLMSSYVTQCRIR